MSTDVEKLKDLHDQLRNARALLPQMLRKLAFATEEQTSSKFFQGVAQDLMAWKASTEALESKYNDLKPLLDELNGVDPTKKAETSTGATDAGTIDLTAS